MGDPLALVILALLIFQGLTYLVSGITSARRRVFDPDTTQRLRKELSEWGIIEPATRTKAPGLPDLLRSWAGISARSRIGMGLGIVMAAGVALGLLASAPQSAIIPPFVLGITLFLQGFSVGMFLGNALGLLIGTRQTPLRPSQQDAGGTSGSPDLYRRLPGGMGRGSGTGASARLPENSPGERPRPAPPGTAALQAEHLPVAPASVLASAGRGVALLPGALLLIDLLLVGGLNLLYLTTFTQAELWSLGVFPAVMLLICLLGAWFNRRLARLPPLRLTSDPALAARADARVRARMIGMMLETQVYSLFILVICQWLVQAFALAHPGGVIYNGSLLVYAVVIFSLRGLLERAEQDAAAA